MEKAITKRQKQLLSILYQYIKNTGYPPSFQEMKERLRVSSNQSIIDLLKKLEKSKSIKRSETTARGLSILPFGYQILGKAPLIPFLGVSQAGLPVEMLEINGQWEELPGNVAKFKDDVFLLKISGDSMLGAGLDDQDMVLVKTQKEFISGDIVLARIGDESTIKRFISEDKAPFLYLKPENPKYDIIPFTEETEMIGKVISALKNNYWKPIK
jgi:repressor LexA